MIAGIAAIIGVGHDAGFPEPAGEEKTGYRAETLCVEYEDIGLYGKALIPDGDGPFSTVRYARGAESGYKADMTTLKGLAMGGVACYTTGTVLSLQGTKDVIVPMEMFQNLTAHYNIRRDNRSCTPLRVSIKITVLCQMKKELFAVANGSFFQMKRRREPP